MNVSVTLFADLRRFGPKNHEGPLTVCVDPGATIEDMLTVMGVPDDEEIRGEITVGLNGELGQRDSVLSEADEILLFSPMAGG